jgi:hypothetical protein
MLGRDHDPAGTRRLFRLLQLAKNGAGHRHRLRPFHRILFGRGVVDRRLGRLLDEQTLDFASRDDHRRFSGGGHEASLRRKATRLASRLRT